jgi:hypothetical protein
MMAIQDFGGLLFGGGGTGLEDYLSADQQSGIRNQAMLQAAAALLQAGGPSRTPISLGQALGGALQAGSAGYQQAQQGAIQNLLTRQKLAEAKRMEDLRKALQESQMQPQAQPMGEVTTITPDQAMAVGGLPAGPTVARANLIGQQVRAPAPQMSQQDMLYQDAMNKYMIADRSGYPEMAAKYLETAQKIKPMEKVVGAPFEVTDAVTGKPIMVQQFDTGRLQTVGAYGPKRNVVLEKLGGVVQAIDVSKLGGGERYAMTLPPQIIGGADAGGYFQVGGGGGMGGGVGGAPRPAGAPAPAGAPSAVAPTAGAGAPQAAPTGLQPLVPIIPLQGKTFANEKDLRGEFQAQVKPFIDLNQAYQKIETAAKNPSAAGDISLIFGFMKVLDPTSVVREGEFATASNAGGVSDTVRNLYNKALNGERLGENIRSDFLNQSRNIVESQRQLSKDLIDRYTEVAKNYKLDPNQIVYDPFKRVQTPEQIIKGGTATNIPQTRQEWWQRFNLKKPNE